MFPGGCFFINAAAELEAREGRVTDYVREVYQGVLDGFTEEIRRAQALGELDAAEDPAQLSFELDSFMVGANLALVFFGDSAAPDRARAAIRDRLERLAAAARAELSGRTPLDRRRASGATGGAHRRHPEG